MSYAPIAYIIPQYEDFQNYWLKAYEQGTTTPLIMATDKAAGTTVSKFELNGEGFPQTTGGALVIPWIAELYDLWLFPTEAEADANNTTNATKLADNMKGVAAFVAGEFVKNFTTVALMVADTDIELNDWISVEDYATGNNSGYLFFKAVAAATGTADGGSFIDLPNTTPTLQAKQNFPTDISLKMFGAVGNDTADDTVVLQGFRDYIAANPEINAVIPEGTYKYTASPNWAIGGSTVTMLGNVTFHNIGTAESLIFDGGAVSGAVFDFRFGWGNRINIDGAASSTHGVFIRACHHCKIAANVRGCGATSDAFLVEFTVATEYDFVASTNEPNNFTTIPARGIVVTRRGSGVDLASANTFHNPIIEGVSGVGIYVDHAVQSTFIGGTSEGNTGDNIECTSNSRNNEFLKIDLEVTGGVGIRDAGRRNRYVGVFSDDDVVFEAASQSCQLIAGQHNEIQLLGDRAKIHNVEYGVNSGEIIDSGTLSTIIDCFDVESATFKQVNKTQGRNDFIDTIVVGVVAATSSVPGIVTKSAVLLAGVEVGDSITLESQTALAAGFIPTPVAVCTVAGQINISFSQLTGGAVTPLPDGGAFTVSVRGIGLTGAITAFADAGSGKVTVTSADHNVKATRNVLIIGTTNYNGVFTVSNITDDTFDITDTWVADDATGTFTEV